MTDSAIEWKRDGCSIGLLALPFVITIIAFRGLQADFPKGLVADEGVYYPTILKFAAQWPHVDLHTYPSVTPPLFHLLCANLVRWFGSELFKLRLANAAISYLAVVAFYGVLRAALAQPPFRAFLCALSFALVPYYFGNCFVLMTDSLGWLFFFCVLFCLLRLADQRRVRDQLLMTLFFGLAVLTRQSYLTLLPFALTVLWLHWDGAWRRLFGVALGMGIAALPYGWLVWLWHGPVPVEVAETKVSSGTNPLAIGFMLSVLGLYVPFYLAGDPPGRSRSSRPRWGIAVAAFLLAVLFLLTWPMTYNRWNHFGALWRSTVAVPHWHGTALLFWGLLPLGLFAVLDDGLRALKQRTWLPLLFLFFYGLPYLAGSIITQRYFDPASIVFLSLSLSCRQVNAPRTTYACVAALCLLCALFDGMRYWFNI